MSKKLSVTSPSRDVLAVLFGSAMRARLLLLLSTTDNAFTQAELAKRAHATPRVAGREIEELARVGLVHLTRTRGAKFGATRVEFDRNHFLANELRSLLLRAQLSMSTKFATAIANMGNVSYFVLVGLFTGVATPVDILAVGRVNKAAFERMMATLERDLGRSINYVLLTSEEFDERRSLPDRFLMNILESRKIVLVDKLNISSRS